MLPGERISPGHVTVLLRKVRFLRFYFFANLARVFVDFITVIPIPRVLLADALATRLMNIGVTLILYH